MAKSDGTIKFIGSNSNALSYSTDDGATWSITSQTPTVNVGAGDKVLWKGTCTPKSSGGIGKFTNGTAEFDVEGNVMSLLFGDEYKVYTSLAEKNYAFYALFTDNTNVISAENLSLPATTLASNCYGDMFYGCTSLTTAPELRATTLANYCYTSMFNGCSSLTTAPVLPAETLAEGCYNGMFSRCSSLTTAPALPATTLANYCYQSMFYYCTSLTTAPELPANTLAPFCYGSMFNGCTSLNNITCLATDISAYNCTGSWVNGVASSGTFIKAASMTGWGTGVNGIPRGWTTVDN